MKKVFLVINPCSGKTKIKDSLLDVISILNDANLETQVAITRYHNHAIDLIKTLPPDIDCVICAGGDGTLNQIITGLIKYNKNLPVGYIPAGSTNDFATTYGLNNNIQKATLDITKREPHKIDIGKFSDETDSYFSYIASFGLFSAVSYETPQQVKNALGHAAYVFEGVRDLGNVRIYPVTVKLKDKIMKNEYIFGAVMNTTSIGGVVKLNADVDMSDGLFEVVLIKNPTTVNDMVDIFNGIANSDFSSDIFDFFKVSEIEFEFEEPMSWSLDGEKRESSLNVNIKNLNKKITIMK